MSLSPSRFACLLVVGTAGLCLPGGAQAASISFDRPCYRGPMAQNLTFSGLAADSEFALWQQDPVIYPDFGYVGDVFSGPGGDATRTRTVRDRRVRSAGGRGQPVAAKRGDRARGRPVPLHRPIGQGPCGTLSKRIAKFPFRPLKKGGWTIQFDNRRSYQHRRYPYVEHQTSVTKTIAKKCKRKRGKRCPKPKTR
jgi:hypothetical protein